ncbi:MAG: LLM class flavin-dependent oxidoreductase [Acidimicrobiia bacterium]|nr:LLM class flavin-dependent oxidoreductase [Acidimicrobiia bacterium]
MKIGLTLPSFTIDPEVPLQVAAAAEAAGVDGLFVYDHLFRVGGDGEMRPALECTALLGALAAATDRITLGTLVVRASLRPAATLATALDTVVRIAGPRLVVGIGSGDEESRVEMETFGLPMGTETYRVKRLRAALRELAGRPYPTWVGGRARHVGLIAAESAQGWNRWGADVETFGREAAEVAALVQRLNPNPDSFTTSWGGLVVLDADDDAAQEKATRLGAGPSTLVGGPRTVATELARYRDAGADWAILGPVDSSDPTNASRIGDELRRLAR